MKHRQVVGALLCCSGVVVGVGDRPALGATREAHAKRHEPGRCDRRSGEIGLPGKVSVSHVTIAEGNRMAAREHDKRTSIVAVVKGVVREHRGEAFKEYKVGDVFTVANQITHYNEAGGTGPARVPSE